MESNHAPGGATLTLVLWWIRVGAEGWVGDLCWFGAKCDDDDPALPALSPIRHRC